MNIIYIEYLTMYFRWSLKVWNFLKRLTLLLVFTFLKCDNTVCSVLGWLAKKYHVHSKVTSVTHALFQSLLAFLTGSGTPSGLVLSHLSRSLWYQTDRGIGSDPVLRKGLSRCVSRWQGVLEKHCGGLYQPLQWISDCVCVWSAFRMPVAGFITAGHVGMFKEAHITPLNTTLFLSLFAVSWSSCEGCRVHAS